MVQINFGKRTIDCRLVYYGPEGSGKTASLELVDRKAPARSGERISAINSEAERTLFFEYRPMQLGRFDGMQTTVHIYTVPGRPSAVSTRMSILRNVDAIIFVADSRPERMQANLDAISQLREELRDLGIKAGSIPMVMQWNHRDSGDALPIGELEVLLNAERHPSFAASTRTGEGVLAALKKASLVTLEGVGERFGLDKTRKVSRASLEVPTPRRSESTRMRAVREQVARLTPRVNTGRKIVGVAPATRPKRSLTQRLFG